MKRVNFGRHSVKLPGNRIARVLLGIALVCGGFLGFLPILGFWMIPLGFAVLAVDIPFVERRWSKAQPRLEAWIARRFPKFWRAYMADPSPDAGTSEHDQRVTEEASTRERVGHR
ncbi:MAG: hypothetical protein AAFZ01_10000 [Pseudomonadota bacterium]